jgi:hypothetical protein
LASAFSKVAETLPAGFLTGERPPAFLKTLANWLALFLKSQANRHKCSPLQRLSKSRRSFSSYFRKTTGSVPATLENALAKLASEFRELWANSKVTGKMYIKTLETNIKLKKQ